MFAGYIHRDISGKPIKPVKQDVGLEARAAAELDKTRLWSDQCCHVTDMCSHNREFSFSQIVFRQLADIVEQFRATRVIEKLRG